MANLNNIISDYLRSPEYGKLKAFHPNVHLETNLETDLLNILGSPIHLSKTVMNLVSNAAEAMPDGGKIRIESSLTPAAAIVSITDNGAGIGEDAAQHIFEPFWTTKPAGTGLGLSISYRIVEAHGGSLTVESPPAGGCRFVITLPVL